MKTLVVALTLILALPALSQKTKNKAVWLKIEDTKVLPVKVGKTFKSTDESLNKIISKYKVKSVEYVFSNSRNPELKKVVEASDIILEILDARDPLGCRNKEIEALV
jgi:hypothetical protein